MKKIGFCFLCVNGLNQLNIWKKFFEGNYERCNIYIHSKNHATLKRDFDKKYQMAEHADTAWGGNLYNAIRIMYRKAIENEDYKVVLVSDSHIPITTFDNVYNFLTSDNKSFIEYQAHIPTEERHCGTLMMQYNRFINNFKRSKEFKYNIDIAHWFFNEMWTILNLEDTKLICDDNKIINYFEGAFAWDENYPSYILSINGRLKDVHKYGTTFVNWGEPEERNGGAQRSPKYYNKIYKRDLMMLKTCRKLFARKFHNDTDIEQYIDFIWTGEMKDFPDIDEAKVDKKVAKDSLRKKLKEKQQGRTRGKKNKRRR